MRPENRDCLRGSWAAPLAAAALGSIRDGVEQHGIESRAAEGWITTISGRPEDRSSFALGPGTATGLNVSYDLRCDGSKDVQVITVHVSPVQ